MRGFAWLSVALLGLGCSSGNFVLPETDGGTSDGAAPGPCAPEPGVAKYCVTLGLIAPRPNYDGASLASSLDIDGKGVLNVYLYDQDPSPATGSTTPAPQPVATLTLPTKTGGEIDLAKDFPTTLAGTAVPKEYWVVAVFKDNKSATRPTDNGGLYPGDFLQVPDIVGKKANFPKITLVEGQVAKLDLTLRPYRAITVNLSTSSDLHLRTSANATVHGDGPMLLLLYQGGANVMDENVAPLSISTVPCVALKPSAPTPPTPRVSFGTWVEGGLQLVAALVDYPGATFPTPDMLTSDMLSPPVVQVSPSTWASTVAVAMTTLLNPYPASSSHPDPYVCP